MLCGIPIPSYYYYYYYYLTEYYTATHVPGNISNILHHIICYGVYTSYGFQDSIVQFDYPSSFVFALRVGIDQFPTYL